MKSTAVDEGYNKVASANRVEAKPVPQKSASVMLEIFALFIFACLIFVVIYYSQFQKVVKFAVAKICLN